MQTKKPEGPCTTMGDFSPVRNRYFAGKYLTAGDFQAEQDYFLSRHRLHDRVLHGQGVVCGLGVVSHQDAACADSWVIVCPGIAIDCCGRELVLEERTPVRIWKPAAEGEEPKPGRSVEEYPAEAGEKTQDATGKSGDKAREGDQLGPFLLTLRYAEELIEDVPSLYAEEDCDAEHQEASRVREIACLEVRRWEEDEDEEPRCRDDCADPEPGPAGVCLEPECAEDQMVPLAIVRPRETEGGFVIDEDAIDTTVQHRFPLSRDFLTHIVHLNWPHGGAVRLSQLRDGMAGRLEVSFDRRLWQPEPTAHQDATEEEPHQGDAIGVNQFTFVVRYGGVQRDIEFLPFDPQHPPTVEEDCRAVFTLDPDYLTRRSAIVGNTVYVALKCDFILDCHGNPVDGDHLRGELPSGNGIAGGFFESWFRVKPDRSTHG